MARPAAFWATLSALALATPAAAERPTTVLAEGGEVSLGYDFDRGASLPYAVSFRTSYEGLEGTTGARINVAISMPVIHEVQSVSDSGSALIATSIRSAAIDAQLNRNTLTMNDVAEQLRSSRVTQTIANDGTTVERTGDIGGKGSDLATGRVSGALADALALGWAQFPTEPVAVGDSWLQVFPSTLGDPERETTASITVRYTMAGFVEVGGRRQALVDLAITTEVEGQTTSASGRAARVVGRGEGEGHLVFDFTAGRLTSHETSTGLVITVTENGGGRTTHAWRTDTIIGAQVFEAAAEAGP